MEHLLENYNCPCNPKILELCLVCNGDGGTEYQEVCEQCNGSGLVEGDPESDSTKIIVHN